MVFSPMNARYSIAYQPATNMFGVLEQWPSELPRLVMSTPTFEAAMKWIGFRKMRPVAFVIDEIEMLG